MLDHLIVTIYGCELSIHRLIQLIDHCFLGDCGKCRGWSAEGVIHSIGDLTWSSSCGPSSGDVGCGLDASVGLR